MGDEQNSDLKDQKH